MKRVISILCCLLLLFSLFALPVGATRYSNNFPTETGLTGGAFIVAMSSIGTITVLIPYNYKVDYFTFSTSGNVINVSSSTIYCAVYKNGTRYDARFNSWGGLSYRVSSSGYYDYSDINITSVVDTNLVFVTNSDKQNESYYFSAYEKFVICLLAAQLFFIFLGWFLWHKH